MARRRGILVVRVFLRNLPLCCLAAESLLHGAGAKYASLGLLTGPLADETSITVEEAVDHRGLYRTFVSCLFSRFQTL